MRDPTQPWAPVPDEYHFEDEALAVAENPASEEVKLGYPLAGKAGAEWNATLAAIGKKREQIALVHTIACQPPGEVGGAYKRMERQIKRENARLRHLAKLEGKKVETAHQWPTPAECCAPRVQAAVQRFSNILTLGGSAAKAVFHTAQGVMAIRGGPIELPTSVPGIVRKCLPTLHPAFVLRAMQWRDVFQADIAKAFRWFEGKRTWHEPLYEWKPTPERLREWLFAPARFTVYDYETSGKDPLTCRVDCLGFARLIEPPRWQTCEECGGSGRRVMEFVPGEGWVQAAPARQTLHCVCCEGKGTRLVDVETLLVPIESREDRSRRFYLEHEEEAVKGVLREWFPSGGWKVAHNCHGFDDQVTMTWLGVRPWPEMDTLGMARARAPDLPKGLGPLGSILTDVHSWKSDADGVKIAFSAQSDRQLHYYCAPGDCAVNAKIFDPLFKIASERGYFRPIYEHLKPKGWPAYHPWNLAGVDAYRMEMCRHFHSAGLYVDQEKRAGHEVKLDGEARKYRHLAQKYAHALGITGKTVTAKGVDTKTELFNPGSRQQIARIFFDEWGLVPAKFSAETGEASVDDEVMRGILTDGSVADDRKAFVDYVRRYNRARKAKSTFCVPLRLQSHDPENGLVWDDGRMHNFTSAMITSVARLNSSGVNLQNVPVRFRDQYAAQPIYPKGDSRYPGRIMIGGDVDQFHLRIIANRWRVGRLLEGFFKGIDPHCALAYDFFGSKFKHASGWGPAGFSLLQKDKPKKDSAADKMRNMSKIIRYQGAYADIAEGIWKSVVRVENKDSGDMPFADMTVREVTKLYNIWMRAEPEWMAAWEALSGTYARNGGWIEEAVFGRRSGGLENGKVQAVVNYDILAIEPALFSIIECNLRTAFPENFEGAGTGVVSQTHDAANGEMQGFAWEEDRNGKIVVVCDEQTEKRRQLWEECMTIPAGVVPGWDIPITAEAKVGPVRRVDGTPCLSNLKES